MTIGQQEVTLQPRLSKHDGRIRVIQPASGLYVSYDYVYAPEFILLDHGTNHPAPLQIRVLLPRGKKIEEVSIDGSRIDHHMETVHQDNYCAFEAPSGVHRAVITLKSQRVHDVFHTASGSTRHTLPS